MIEEVQMTQDIVNGPVFELRLGGELVIAQRFENCRKRSCFLPKIFCLLDWLSSANAIFYPSVLANADSAIKRLAHAPSNGETEFRGVHAQGTTES